MVNRFGNLEPFFPEGPTLNECAQFGMARGEVGPSKHGR